MPDDPNELDLQTAQAPELPVDQRDAPNEAPTELFDSTPGPRHDDAIGRLGLRVGSFEIKQWLGGGGFGNVFVASRIQD